MECVFTNEHMNGEAIKHIMALLQTTHVGQHNLYTHKGTLGKFKLLRLKWLQCFTGSEQLI